MDNDQKTTNELQKTQRNFIPEKTSTDFNIVNGCSNLTSEEAMVAFGRAQKRSDHDDWQYNPHHDIA